VFLTDLAQQATCYECSGIHQVWSLDILTESAHCVMPLDLAPCTRRQTSRRYHAPGLFPHGYDARLAARSPI